MIDVRFFSLPFSSWLSLDPMPNATFPNSRLLHSHGIPDTMSVDCILTDFYSGSEGLHPVQFCACASGVPSPQLFQHEDPYYFFECKSTRNNSLPVPSQMPIFAPIGEQTEVSCDMLQINKICISFLLQMMRSGSTIPHRVPLSDNCYHPQPISDTPSFDTNWMRSYDSNHRTDLFAGPNQRDSERNIHPRDSTMGLAYEIPLQHSQLFSQVEVPSMGCENCHILISNHLIGNGRVCSNCLIARRPALPAEPPSPFSSRDSVKLKYAIDDDAAPVKDVIRMKVCLVDRGIDPGLDAKIKETTSAGFWAASLAALQTSAN